MKERDIKTTEYKHSPMGNVVSFIRFHTHSGGEREREYYLLIFNFIIFIEITKGFNLWMIFIWKDYGFGDEKKTWMHSEFEGEKAVQCKEKEENKKWKIKRGYEKMFLGTLVYFFPSFLIAWQHNHDPDPGYLLCLKVCCFFFSQAMYYMPNTNIFCNGLTGCKVSVKKSDWKKCMKKKVKFTFNTLHSMHVCIYILYCQMIEIKKNYDYNRNSISLKIKNYETKYIWIFLVLEILSSSFNQALFSVFFHHCYCEKL